MKKVILFLVGDLWPWGSFTGIIICIIWANASYIAATWDTPGMLVTIGQKFSALWLPVLVGILCTVSFTLAIEHVDITVIKLKNRFKNNNNL